MRLPLLALVVLLVACSPTPTPTPEPTASPEPTLAPVPTSTLAPTLTAEPTASPEPTITVESAAPPTPMAAASGAAGAGGAVAAPTQVRGAAKPLKVEFTDLHYECQKFCNYNFFDEGTWSYRRFQTLMKVENVSADLILTGGLTEREGWAPTRWILTDGAREWVDDYAWQWTQGDKNLYGRPDLPPGAKSEWTWMAQPIPYGAWVKAVEYEDPWGNLYRQDFIKPEPGQFNYVDCGEPREGGC